ncbi:bifunctional ADP-dependent NAD(P)H-hydrate dehydratase/NAD(P)H-hydrate epimerase [Desulfogranum mediterraneum]|uniref:bifunctional ADP-dependent NAD(P)H-hydrate dehydratase/NAD(P)H-hydrate epimerase n=1 Tax=Desulfogranum mediterraneum TaxID=160661 RepID=UPI000405C1F0|nr:bifunctional ADP-dependent NAD(P)H-hydrate dehydratase/NAD(P)H-hydrate epimerase [Desulfogranum mediterraneum]
MQLASSAQMRELDRRTIEEYQLPGMVLMENAGRGTVEAMARSFGPLMGRQVIVFAGPGNNGGDGSVIARTVLNQGAYPRLFYLVDPATLKGDAGHNFRIIQKLQIPYTLLTTDEKLAGAEEQILDLLRDAPLHSLVDALFGIGLDRPLEGRFLAAVQLINRLRRERKMQVVSVDIPSGLNSDTAQVQGEAIQADLTVTYGLAKPGHFHHGAPAVGRLERVDIGIPPQLHRQGELPGTALTAESLPRLKGRSSDSHKGSNGHLLILAGSRGTTGAAILAAQGALRSGSGLVSLGVPHELNPIFEARLIEAMTVPLANSATALSHRDLETIIALLADKDSLVLGPGMGTEADTARLVLHLYQHDPRPQVVDADALNILGRHPEILSRAAGVRILTPHPGEMARLCSSTVQAVQRDRLAAAQWLSRREGERAQPLITILKGAGTVIADGQGRWSINTSGNPGMATGGMGDVLAGIIGGFLAQGLDPWEAACLGVYLHGRSGDDLADSRPFGYTASELADQLPATMAELAAGGKTRVQTTANR